MAIDKITLAAARKYTDESLLGGGAIKGKNCIISSITPTPIGNDVVFSYTLDDGTQKTSSMTVNNGKDGSTITDIEIKEISNEYHLICTVADAEGNNTEIDAGIIPNAKVKTASKTEAGIVKIGNGLEIDDNGVLSADIGTTVIEISRAEYDALTDEEREDKVYYIYDDNDTFSPPKIQLDRNADDNGVLMTVTNSDGTVSTSTIYDGKPAESEYKIEGEMLIIDNKSDATVVDEVLVL